MIREMRRDVLRLNVRRSRGTIAAAFRMTAPTQR